MFADRHFHRGGRWRKTPPSTDTTAPTIFGVDVTEADTSATVAWSLDEPATGFVEYGTTTAYGSQTTFEANYLTYHLQAISGLSADTTYYYRIVSVDASGNGGEYTDSFTTTGSFTAPSPVTFGPGIAAIQTSVGAKENVKMTDGAVAVRFTASESSQVVSIAMPFTNRNSSYGGGDGGSYLIGVQTLDGSGLPSGTWVDSATEAFMLPIITSPLSFSKRITFSDGPTLTAGTDYAVVVENVHASPDANWSSYNLPWNPQARSFPMHEHESYYTAGGPTSRLVLGNSTYSSPFTWIYTGSSKFNTYPSFALEYASGGYEGFAGINARLLDSEVGNVTSATTCTWRWTHYGDSISFDTVGVLAWRETGTDDMTVSVKKGGVEQETGTFLASSDLGGNTSYDWVEATLTGTVSATAGDVMEVVFSVASGEYIIPTILCHESGTASDQRMLSMPYLGDTTTRHLAYENTSLAYPAWGSYTTYMAYVRLV